MVKYSHIYPYIHIHIYIYIFMINDSPLLTRYFSIKSYYIYIHIYIYILWYDCFPLPVASHFAAARCPWIPCCRCWASMKASRPPRCHERTWRRWCCCLEMRRKFFFFDQKKRPWEKIRFLNGLYGKNPSFFFKTNPRFFQWHSTKTIRNEEKLICSMAFSNFLIFYGIL